MEREKVEWRIERRKISELHRYPLNPRSLSKHDAKHLKESIERFGQCQPIVINADNTCIGGHQRLETMRKLKYKEVDVEVPHRLLTDEEVQELNIRLNRNGGEWDYDMLANGWDTHNLLNWGFTEVDFGIDKDVLEAVDKGFEAKEEKFDMLKIEAHSEDTASLKKQIKKVLEGFPRCKMKK